MGSNISITEHSESRDKVKSIEIWRFIWAINILGCHAQLLPWNYTGEHFFRCTSMGVEFFFILSGWLLANSVGKKNGVPENLGKETWVFLWRKAKAIYPYFIFAFVFELVVSLTLRTTSGLQRSFIYQYIWDFSFLRATGLGGLTQSAVGATWYISAMFLAMAFIYPLIRRYPQNYLWLVAPLSSLMIFGWFETTYGHINFVLTFEHNICLGLLRAIAEINLGCVCWLINSIVSEKKPSSRFGTLCWTAAELLPMMAIWYIATHYARAYESSKDFFCILLFAIGIIAAFSKRSLSMKLFEKADVKWASEMSLAIFLNHYVWIRTLQDWKLPIPFKYELLILVIMSFLTALLCVVTVDFVQSCLRSVREKRKAVNA